jgi:hypothetical protein
MVGKGVPMLGYFLADFAYFLALMCDLIALLLVLEWFFHTFPGAGLNGIRRFLFQTSFPFLSWSETFLSFKWGSFQTRGLLIAFFLIAISHLGVPWLVLLSFSLRG